MISVQHVKVSELYRCSTMVQVTHPYKRPPKTSQSVRSREVWKPAASHSSTGSNLSRAANPPQGPLGHLAVRQGRATQTRACIVHTVRSAHTFQSGSQQAFIHFLSSRGMDARPQTLELYFGGDPNPPHLYEWWGRPGLLRIAAHRQLWVAMWDRCMVRCKCGSQSLSPK